MSSEDGLPPGIERLLHDHVTSVASVELVFALREAGSQGQSVEDLARTLRCPGSWADQELERLQQLGLVSDDGEGRFVLRPRSPDLGQAVDGLAKLWYTDRRAVTRWLFARRSGGRHGADRI